MDRAQILTYLQAAEQRVANGERQIANRRDFVLSLKCAGAGYNREIAELLEMEKAHCSASPSAIGFARNSPYSTR